MYEEAPGFRPDPVLACTPPPSIPARIIHVAGYELFHPIAVAPVRGAVVPIHMLIVKHHAVATHVEIESNP